MAKRTDRKRAAWHPLQSPCNPRPGLVPGPVGPEGLCSRTQEWRGQSFKNRREGDSHSSRRCPLAALRGCPHIFGCSRPFTAPNRPPALGEPPASRLLLQTPGGAPLPRRGGQRAGGGRARRTHLFEAEGHGEDAHPDDAVHYVHDQPPVGGGGRGHGARSGARGPGCEAPGPRGPEGDRRLPGGGGLAGRRRGQSTSGPPQTPRPPHGILPRSLPLAASASPRPDPEEPPAPTRHTSARLRGRPGAHTSACRGLPCPEVTVRGGA